MCRCQSQRSANGGATKATLWIIGLLGVLAYFSIGGFHKGQVTGRNKTTVSLAAIKSDLEQYKEKYGYYPEPAVEAQKEVGTFDGVTMNSGMAAMLYQAITGDGSDYLKSEGKGAPSDGIVDAQEVGNSINSNLPPRMIFFRGKGKGVPGPRYLVDGYGRPFQYTKGGHPDAVNERYDAWSYGDAPDGLASGDLATKNDSQKTASWIKNW